MRHLPLAFRCDRQWAAMSGDEVVRRCQDCNCEVVNLSALDEATARSLLEQQTARACVSYRHENGRIVFARSRRILAAAAAAAVLLAAAPSGADTSPPPPPHRRVRPPEKKRDEREPPLKKKKNRDDDNFGGILTPRF